MRSQDVQRGVSDIYVSFEAFQLKFASNEKKNTCWGVFRFLHNLILCQKLSQNPKFNKFPCHATNFKICLKLIWKSLLNHPSANFTTGKLSLSKLKCHWVYWMESSLIIYNVKIYILKHNKIVLCFEKWQRHLTFSS